jgi:hypothetical protein
MALPKLKLPGTPFFVCHDEILPGLAVSVKGYLGPKHTA